VSDVVVSLRGGPADGKTVELEALPDEELELEVARVVPFGLTGSIGASEPIVSGHRLSQSVRHRYRLVQRHPPMMEWVGQVTE